MALHMSVSKSRDRAGGAVGERRVVITSAPSRATAAAASSGLRVHGAPTRARK
jgi:hypothetical protein